MYVYLPRDVVLLTSITCTSYEPQVCIVRLATLNTSPSACRYVCLPICFSHLQAETGLLAALLCFASRVSRVDHADPSDIETNATHR